MWCSSAIKIPNKAILICITIRWRCDWTIWNNQYMFFFISWKCMQLYRSLKNPNDSWESVYGPLYMITVASCHEMCNMNQQQKVLLVKHRNNNIGKMRYQVHVYERHVKELGNVISNKRRGRERERETNCGTLFRDSFRACETRGDPESSFRVP